MRDSFETAASLLACGVDVDKSCLFRQSQVLQHSELMWILTCMTPLSWLNKMTQFKEKSATKDQTSLGLYGYPTLMASDILVYKATHVPVGNDQTQHLEFTVDVAERLNSILSHSGVQVPLPKAIGNEEKRVMSLQNGSKKMSKSDGTVKSIIYLTDAPEEIRSKIMKAKTDSLGSVSYLPEKRPEVANLLRMYAYSKNVDVRVLDEYFDKDNMF